nr:transporter [Burkholderiales bacterium]
MKNYLRATLASAFIFCAASAPAQQEGSSSIPQPTAADASDTIATDRPDFTESPLVVPLRFRAQIESGYTFTRSGEDREHTVGEILVRVPVAKRVELRFGIPSYLVVRSDAEDDEGGDASGFEDASLGAKFALSEGSSENGLVKWPAMALIVGTSLPTGASAFREDDLQPDAVFAMAVNLTEQIALASNLGYSYAADRGDRFDQFFASVSLAVDLTEQVGTYFEVYGFTRVEAATSDGARFFNTGLTYLVDDDFQLDTRVGVGLDNDVSGPDTFFGFGFARRF